MFSSRPKIVAPKIVQPGAGRGKWWLLILLLLIAVWTWLVFDFGRQRAGLDVSGFHAEIDDLEVRIKQQAKKIEQLRVESASHQRAAQIDREAVNLAQADIKALQQERASLKREVDLLNGLLSDNSLTAVLRLKQLMISKGGSARQYRVKFTLVQLSKEGATVKGQAKVSLTGQQGGKEVSLDLAKLTGGKSKGLKMGFKNFQKFDVTLSLPEGFDPVSVTLTADVEGKGPEDLEETQPWKVAAS